MVLRTRVRSLLACLVSLSGTGEQVAAQAAPSPCLEANFTTDNILKNGLLFQDGVGLTLDVAGESGQCWTLPYQGKRSIPWN